MNGGAVFPLIHFLFSLHRRVWKHHTASCYLLGSPFLLQGVLAVSTRGKKLRQRNQVKYVAVAMRSLSRGDLCVVCMLMLHCCTSVPCWVLADTSGSHSRITVGGAGTAPVSLARLQKLVGGYSCVLWPPVCFASRPRWVYKHVISQCGKWSFGVVGTKPS